MRLRRPIQTRFRYGSPSRVNLATHHNSQAHSSKGTWSLHISSRLITLPRLVGTRFQVLFHSPPGVLFTFPSRYSSAIGHQEVFRLDGWSRQIHTGFLGPRATWDTVRKSLEFRLRGCHPLCRRFPGVFGYPNDFLLPARSAALAGRSHNPDHATPAGYDT